MANTFQDLNKKYYKNQSFENSKSWEKAYLTDFFNILSIIKFLKFYPI